MHWIRRHRRGRPPHPDVLTPAEWRVLEHVREGRPNAEIAVRLGVSVTTVKTHVSSILAKTGASDRRALAEWEGRPAPVERRAAHALALPFLGRGMKEALMSTLKLAGLGAGALVAVAAVVVGFALFSDARADDGVVAVIEGIEVTEEEWETALALPGGEEVVRCSIRALEAEGRDTADAHEDREFLGRHADLYASHSREAVVLTEVIEDRAIEALAAEKGLEPTEEQVATAVAEYRRQIDQLRSLPYPSGPPCFLQEVDVAIEAVGEGRYWDEVVPEQERRSLRERLLWEAGHLGPIDSTALYALAGSAEVELRPALEDVVTLEEAYAFRDEFRELYEGFLAESQQGTRSTPTP